MKRPVKFTNISSKTHARKLHKALRDDFPGWIVTLTQAADQRYSVCARPPETSPDEAKLDSPCPLPEPLLPPARKSREKVGYHFPARHEGNGSVSNW